MLFEKGTPAKDADGDLIAMESVCGDEEDRKTTRGRIRGPDTTPQRSMGDTIPTTRRKWEREATIVGRSKPW